MQVTCYSDDVIQAQRTNDGIMHQSLLISISVNVLLNKEHILDHFFKQLCLRVITLRNYDVIVKTKCKVRLRNLPTF